MFIVQTKDGKTFVEGKEGFVWDNIPDDVEITSLSLTLPFKVSFKTKSGDILLNPKFTIKDFDSYFFSNEETISILAVNSILGKSNRVLTAKIIGGIKGDNVFVYRMDRHGNIKSRIFSFSELEKSYNLSAIRKGLTN